MTTITLLFLLLARSVVGRVDLNSPSVLDGPGEILDSSAAAAADLAQLQRLALRRDCETVDADYEDSDRQSNGLLWPRGQVPYTIDRSVRHMTNNIMAAIRQWEQHTCLRFRQDNAFNNRNARIKFANRGEGCKSPVGYMPYPDQVVNLGGDGCNFESTVVHEIGHAIGLKHQQARPDRDSYIRILTQNIKPWAVHNFVKGDPRFVNNHSVPYDLNSIMHYDAYSFTNNDQPTLLPLELQYMGVLGESTQLTHRDKMLVNRMYQCNKRCGNNVPHCLNGGYVDSSCRCVCPPRIQGRNCEISSIDYDYYDVCGDQNIRTEGVVTSINWPNIFPPGENCFWKITAPRGRRVRIDFTDFKMIYREKSDRLCKFDRVNIYLRGEYPADLTLCEEEGKHRSFTSQGSVLSISMRSHPGQNFPSMQKGFSANIKFV